MSRSSLMSQYFQQPVSVDIGQLPGWVLGGGFNQIEEDVMGLNAKRQALESQQIANEINSRREQELAAQMEFQNKLSGVLKTEKPTTLRDMYTKAQQVALESGRPSEGIQFADALERMEREQRNARIQAISNSRMLFGAGADDLAVQLLEEQGIPGAMLNNEESRRLREMRGMFSGASDRVVMTPDGPKVVYDAPEKPKEVKEPKKKTWYRRDGSPVTFPDTDEGNTEAINQGLFEDLDETDYEPGVPRGATPTPKPSAKDWALSALSPFGGGETKSPPLTPTPAPTPPQKEGSFRESDQSFTMPDNAVIRGKSGQLYRLEGGKPVPYSGKVVSAQPVRR